MISSPLLGCRTLGPKTIKTSAVAVSHKINQRSFQDIHLTIPTPLKNELYCKRDASKKTENIANKQRMSLTQK